MNCVVVIKLALLNSVNDFATPFGLINLENGYL
jgi:hypothetical protein